MVYVFIAEGFEEIEAITPIDLLRRAGKQVTTVGVTGRLVTGAHGIPITTDITCQDQSSFADAEMVVLPGGMPGTRNLEGCEAVQTAIDYCAARGIHLAAICAAPMILGHKNYLAGKKAVCYRGFEMELVDADIQNQGVVTDGNITTARGAGTALEFGLELIRVLCGEEKQAEIRAAIQCDDL
ncbi:MAG: DJ-1/PfpI family protein [Ruminococcus sp.]|nr:DJ-1/PfpI family protein [Ruminococcus sp.]